MAAPLIAYVRTSAGWLKQDPATLLMLGLAVVASSSAVCCFGVGIVFAGWFGCELQAAQLRLATGIRPRRTNAWIAAGVVLMGAVGLLASAGWLSFLGLGADMPVLEGVPMTLDTDVRIATFTTAAVLLALHFILPMSFTPLILIEKGGRLGDAVAVSASLVSRLGTARLFGVSLVAHALQFAPGLLVGLVVAFVAGRASVPYATVLTLPLLVVTTPLGQGVFVAAYHALESAHPADAPVPLRILSPRVRVMLGTVVLAPVVLILLLGISLAKPSRPHVVATPAQGEVVAASDATEAVLNIPDTALVVRMKGGRVRIDTLDGGGAGRLRLGAVTKVRVVRVRDAYAVVMTSKDHRTREVWVDRAGVRLDDNLGVRLTDHVPWWGIVALALYAFFAPLVLARALVPMVMAQRAGSADSPVAERRAVAHFAALFPLGVACVVAGVLAVLG